MLPSWRGAIPSSIIPRMNANTRRSIILTIAAGSIGTCFFRVFQSSIFAGFVFQLGPAFEGYFPIIAGLIPLCQSAQLLGSRLMERTGWRRGIFTVGQGLSRLVWFFIGLLPFAVSHARSELRLVLLFGSVALSFFLLALGEPAWLSWVGDLVPSDRRARYFGIFRGVGAAVGATFGIASGAYLDAKGWTPEAFMIVIFAGALAGTADIAIWYLWVHHPTFERPAGRRPMLGLLRESMTQAGFVKLLAVLFIWYFTLSMMGCFDKIYRLNRLGLTMLSVEIIEMLETCTFVAFAFMWGHFADRYGRKRTLQIGLGSAAVCVSLYFVARDDFYYPITILFVLSGIAISAVFVCHMSLLLDLTRGELRSTSLAAAGVVAGLAGFGGPNVGRVILNRFEGLDISLRWVHIYDVHVIFGAGVILYVLGLVVASTLPRDGGKETIDEGRYCVPDRRARC
jgi:MFS family permease